jgi:hypothetical protein
VDGNDVAVLHTEVVAHNAVDAGTAIIEIIIGQDNQHSVLALLALDQNCVAPEELEGFHGVVGESNNGVVIVDGIGHAVMDELSTSVSPSKGVLLNWGGPLHQRVGLLLLLKDGSSSVELLLTLG